MQRIKCPSCGASYRFDPASVPPEGARLTCPACNQKWTVKPPETDASAAEAEPAATTSESVTCPQCGHVFQPAASRPQRSVLVVDDQEFFRNFAVETLSRDFAVHIAKSTEEAVRRAHEFNPDAIVLDLGLEKGADDGKEVLRLLERRFPVVILTGRTDFDPFGADWQELVDLGARELVTKGFNMDDELRSKVKRVIEAG